jgi:hypothetical protein
MASSAKPSVLKRPTLNGWPECKKDYREQLAKHLNFEGNYYDTLRRGTMRLLPLYVLLATVE